MTPHELNLHTEIYSEKLKFDQEEKLMVAYMTARWHRIDKLESFNHYLEIMNQPEQKQMSDMDMLIKVKQLNAALGGNVK